MKTVKLDPTATNTVLVSQCKKDNIYILQFLGGIAEYKLHKVGPEGWCWMRLNGSSQGLWCGGGLKGKPTIAEALTQALSAGQTVYEFESLLDFTAWLVEEHNGEMK